MNAQLQVEPLGKMPPVEPDAPLRLAYDTRNFVRWRDPPRAAAGCVLPVQGDADVLALIVLETAGQLGFFNRDRSPIEMR